MAMLTHVENNLVKRIGLIAKHAASTEQEQRVASFPGHLVLHPISVSEDSTEIRHSTN